MCRTIDYIYHLINILRHFYYNIVFIGNSFPVKLSPGEGHLRKG